MPYGDSVVWGGEKSSEEQSVKWEVTEAARRRDAAIGPVTAIVAKDSNPVAAATALESAWTLASNGITATRTGAKVTFSGGVENIQFSTNGGTSYTSLPSNGNNEDVGSTGLNVHNAS